MSFITPPGVWLTLNTNVGTTSQSYVSFGFNTASQVPGPAVKIKVFTSGTARLAIGSHSYDLTGNGFYLADQSYNEFNPAGQNAQGITLIGEAPSSLSFAYYVVTPHDWLNTTINADGYAANFKNW